MKLFFVSDSTVKRESDSATSAKLCIQRGQSRHCSMEKIVVAQSGFKMDFELVICETALSLERRRMHDTFGRTMMRFSTTRKCYLP